MPTSHGHFFEDFSTGQTLVHAVPRTITDGDQALYIALTGDRTPIHCAATFAQELGLKRETVNDLLVFHIVFGKTVTDISLNAVANLGYAELKFLAPVYVGDTLRAVSTVLGTKENSSGKTGIVWVETVGTNQRDEEVLRYKRWVMVHKRDPNVATGASDRPTVQTALEVADLSSPAIDASKMQAWASGGEHFFSDFKTGQTQLHTGGMTIEESDHMLATRLYQNTAKVHFDGHGMKDSRFGRRLMYGGHVISVCRALTFDVFANALGIAGFNGGTHSAPTFAGDTLYARSEILDVQPAPGRDDLGFVRARLVGIKNDSLDVPLRVEKDGKKRHHPSVVLDLDYWLIVAAKPAKPAKP